MDLSHCQKERKQRNMTLQEIVAKVNELSGKEYFSRSEGTEEIKDVIKNCGLIYHSYSSDRCRNYMPIIVNHATDKRLDKDHKILGFNYSFKKGKSQGYRILTITQADYALGYTPDMSIEAAVEKAHNDEIAEQKEITDDNERILGELRTLGINVSSITDAAKLHNEIEKIVSYNFTEAVKAEANRLQMEEWKKSQKTL